MFNYKRPFTINGKQGLSVTKASMTTMEQVVTVDGVEIGRDHLSFMKDGPRNLMVEGTLPDGTPISVESGYINMWATGIAVRSNGELIHESHPGKTIAWPDMPGVKASGDHEARKAFAAAEAKRMKETWPSIVVDIGLGLLFFVVGKYWDLTTAAVVGVIAGVALLIIQRFVKNVDLVGGLALFGVGVMAVSATYALIVQDDELIKMRSTIIGSAVALLFLTDGLLLKGKMLGRRLIRYMPTGTDTVRMTVGIGGIGLFMALANWLVVKLVSTDTWLWYTTFGDTILSMGLVFAVLAWARRKKPTAAE